MAINQLVSSGANSLVQAGWTNAQEYASDAFARASQFLNQLQSIAGQLTALPDIGVNVGSPEHTVDPMSLPDPIARPTDLTPAFPEAPAEPTLADVAGLSLPTAPEFSAALPDIDLAIAAPTPLAADLPADPTLADVAIP